MESSTNPLRGEINLAATLDCGQAFRWRRDGDWFRGVIGRRVVWLRQNCGSEFHPRENAEVAISNRSHNGVEWRAFPSSDAASDIAHYLALDEPLRKIVASFPDDKYFREAVRQFYGMRMLRQEPWETLASFIASSTKQIVQIKQIVENLCATFGEEIANSDFFDCHPERSEGSQRGLFVASDEMKRSRVLRGRPPTRHSPNCVPDYKQTRKEFLRCAQNDRRRSFFTFPSPDKIASATHQQLWDCKLGFRAKYLLATARRIDSGELDLSALAKMETPRAREELMKCDGVGEKIANCVLLFGYGRHEACPIDVWIGRSLRELYFQEKGKVTPRRLREFASSYLGPNAGYAQQYLFHYVRMNPEVLEM
jgi:3-methyladenine DNA glycosylase/8-oxoguanine DNA glycosylase